MEAGGTLTRRGTGHSERVSKKGPFCLQVQQTHGQIETTLDCQIEPELPPDELESEKLRILGIPSFHLKWVEALSLVARCILFPFVSIFQQLRFKGANVRDKKS